MTTSMKYRTIGLALALLLLPSCNGGNAPAGLAGGDAAPDVSGEDVKGEKISLSQFRGKAVLLDFWATWCSPCVGEIPHERELHQQYGARPFVILGVSSDESREKLSQFLDSQRLPWPNIWDPSAHLSKQWKIQGIPTFVLIDHQGNISKRWVGAGQSNEIRAAVDEAVRNAEKAGTTGS